MAKKINPVKIEAEHKLAYSKLLSYNKKHKKLPPPNMMYKWIAMDHIKEHGKKYYTALVKMEKNLK